MAETAVTPTGMQEGAYSEPFNRPSGTGIIGIKNAGQNQNQRCSNGITAVNYSNFTPTKTVYAMLYASVMN